MRATRRTSLAFTVWPWLSSTPSAVYRGRVAVPASWKTLRGGGAARPKWHPPPDSLCDALEFDLTRADSDEAPHHDDMVASALRPERASGSKGGRRLLLVSQDLPATQMNGNESAADSVCHHDLPDNERAATDPVGFLQTARRRTRK